MSDLCFIKNFKEIKVKKICNKYSIDISNLYRGNVKKEKIHKVRKELERELLQFLLLGVNDETDNTL